MKKFSFLIVLLVLVLGGLGAWWINGTSSANSADKKEKTFEVTQGEGVKQIANDLKAQGLIKDPVIFFLLIKQKGVGNKIQAGKFQLSSAMSAGKIADILQLATDDVRITIPEGKRAREVDEILKAHFANYQISWEQQLVANEGYLFPDTYSFNKTASIESIIATMRANFDKKYATITGGRKSNLTNSQILTIASLVEREAKFPEDRPLVASVILNRINAGMPLQIDATVQYALGYQPAEQSWWKKNLTIDDLHIDSPYNTYANTGLPPTPISNPGIEALTAVVTAPQTNYVFYVSDKSGHNHYEVTSDQHDADIKKYGL